jgi:hypothetical protein
VTTLEADVEGYRPDVGLAGSRVYLSSTESYPIGPLLNADSVYVQTWA